MATMNISLPDALKGFVESEVSDGGYSTASEYFRELLRDAQKRKAEAKLEKLLLEGLESGEGVPVTPEWWENLRRELVERHRKRESA